MPTYNAANAACLIYTYKDGLLSAVAHDLQIRVTDWDLNVDVDAKTVTGRFSANSLVVLGAVQGGELTDALSDKDKDTIQGNIQKDVLDSRKFSEIRFKSTKFDGSENSYSIEGELTLHGVTKTVRCTAQGDADAFSVSLTLNQPDFGIKPYSAMFGTLKVKPELKVVLRVPRNV